MKKEEGGREGERNGEGKGNNVEEGRRVRDKEMLTKKRKESTVGVCRRR